MHIRKHLQECSMNIAKIIVLGLTTIVFFSCSTQRVNITVADLSPDLKEFENSPEYDYISGKIGYDAIGIANYDSIFQEVAFIRAFVLQSTITLERMVGDSSCYEPTTEETNQFANAMYAMVRKQIRSTPKRAKELLTRILDLNPKKDFAGIKSLKLASAISSIQSSVQDLNAIGNSLLRIAELIVKSPQQKPCHERIQVSSSDTADKHIQSDQPIQSTTVVTKVATTNTSDFTIGIVPLVTSNDITKDQARFFAQKITSEIQKQGYHVPKQSTMQKLQGKMDSLCDYDCLRTLGNEHQINIWIKPELLSIGTGFALHCDMILVAQDEQISIDTDRKGDLQTVASELIQQNLTQLHPYLQTRKPQGIETQSASKSDEASTSIDTVQTQVTAKPKISKPVRRLNQKGTVLGFQQSYQTIQIGSQVWMAQNLNELNQESGKQCYNQQESSCQVEGGLYRWDVALQISDSCKVKQCSQLLSIKHQGVCPQGWHIPSQQDWEILFRQVGKESSNKLRAVNTGFTNWDSAQYYYGDRIGMSIRPSGSLSPDGKFSNQSISTCFLTTSENSTRSFQKVVLKDNSVDAIFTVADKRESCSVRCLKD